MGKINLKIPIITASTCALIALAQLVGVIDLTIRIQAFVAAYISIALIFLNKYRGSKSIDFFSPAIGLVVLLFLYSLSSALYVESTGVTAQNDPVSDDTILLYYYSCIAGLLGLAFGMLWAQRFILKTRSLSFISGLLINNRIFYKKLTFLVVITSVLFFPKIFPWFNFTKVPSYAERALIMRLERMDNSASGLIETFFTNLPITLILCLATYFIFKKQNYLYKSAGLIVLLSYLIRNTMAGWRGQVMAAVLIPVIYYHYQVRRINALAACIAGLAVYLFINILSLVRSTSDISEMYYIVSNQLKMGDLKFLSLASSSELLVGTNLLRLISGIEQGESSYTYGLSILSEFLVYIPKALLSSRPLSLSENFAATFYPGVLEEGGGLGFFFLQEGYWISGVSGVFILTFVYGWAVQKIYQWVINNQKYNIVTFAYVSIYNVLILSAVRSGLFANFKIMLMGLIPFILIAYLPTINLTFNRAPNKSNEGINQ